MKSNVPARAFAARSLVGQTMGARKRLAFWEAYVPFCEQDPSCGETPPASWRRRSIGAVSHSDDLRAAYLKARAKYRIGERLRPCVGCWRCRTNRVCAYCGEIDNVVGECEVCDATRYERIYYTCDGSGVLPAGRRGR